MTANSCQAPIFRYAKLKHMRRKKRHLSLLVISLLSFVSLFYLVLNYDPAQQFTIYNLQFTITMVFFLFLFLSSSLLMAYVLNNLRRGIFFGLFMISYFLLRLFHLTQTSFFILLIAFFITLEFFFSHKR